MKPTHSPLSHTIATLFLVLASVLAARSTSTARAATPHGHAPSIRAIMTLQDDIDRRTIYRVVGTLVQRSVDAGMHWSTILASTTHRDSRTGCALSDYAAVTGLQVNPLLSGYLFVTTRGSAAVVGRRCTAATGGLFVLRPNGYGGYQTTHSQAAGLPYAQDRKAKTPRAYALNTLFSDPTTPNVLYTDAVPASSAPPGPGSPPSGLYRSLDGGRSWSYAGRGLPTTGSGSRRGTTRGTITPNPAIGGIVYDVVGTRLYRGTTRGAAWYPVAGIRARRSLTLVINQANPLILFALTDSGSYASRDAGKTWSSYKRPVTSRVFYMEANDATIPGGPKPPRFDVPVTLVPAINDRVVLAVHTRPAMVVTLSMVRGAKPISVRLKTDSKGFGHAGVALGTGVVPTRLRVKVDASGLHETIAPWLMPGWAPGTPPAPPTPAATGTNTAIAIPTAYPASSLGTTWQWKQLISTLPACPGTPAPPIQGTATPTFTPSSTPATAPSSTASPATSTPTSTPIGPCNAGSPAARQDESVAWDNTNRLLYVFGGTDAARDTAYNDLTAYSTISNTWTAITPSPFSPIPLGRYGAGAVWSSSLNAFLVFGGMSGAGTSAHFLNEVWSYTPASHVWTQLSANGADGAPAPRAHAGVAWDSTNNRLLVYGGQTDDNPAPGLTNDLWTFTPSATGGTWTNLSPNGPGPVAPPRREDASLAWDNGTVRLFGGLNAGGGSLSDTWAWTSSGGWSFVNAPIQPPGRHASGYAWDDTHERFIVGPGLSMLGATNDVWEFESPSNTWQQVPISNPTAPPLRYLTGMVWDGADNQAILFGGHLVAGGLSQGLWALIPTGTAGPTPTPSPAAHLAKGVNLQQVVNMQNNHLTVTDAELQRAADSGASYVRISFYIGNGHATWTDARLQAYEHVVTMVHAHGLDVLAVASSGITGGWATDSWTQNAQETSGGNGANAAIGDYVDQLSLLVSHFRQAPYNITRWELWNEPNVALSSTCGVNNPNCLQHPSLWPSNFAALLLASYNEIKGNGERDPATHDVQIVSGAVFAHSINGTYSAANAGATYIAAVYNEGINHHIWPSGVIPFDTVGQHIYVDQNARTTPAVIETYLGWFHAAYAAYDPNRQTSLTEVGWRTGDPGQPSVAPDVQALDLDTAFAAARAVGYIQDLAWYELQDNPADRNGTSFGLVDRYGTRKPAFDHFTKQ